MRELEGRRRTPVFLAVAIAVALIVAGGTWAATRSGGNSADDPFASAPRITVPATVLGRGDIPGGFTWILEARRDGGVCATLTVSPGPPPRERCERTNSGRAFHSSTTSMMRTPDGDTYLTLGWVSDRTEHVRITEAGGTPTEVATLGGGAGLEVRFFVHHTRSNVPVTYAALAADRSELGRVDRPPFNPPR